MWASYPALTRTQSGPNLGYHRDDKLLPCQAEHVPRGAGGQRDVDRGAGGTGVDVIGKTYERIEVVLVDGDVQRARIVAHHRLGPVSVVDIPIQDRHPLTP